MLSAVAKQAPELFLRSESATKGRTPKNRLHQAVFERYRCPENFLQWDLINPLSPGKGYFQFGTDATCYGSSARGWRKASPESSLYDTAGDVLLGENLELPFDPNEIVDNLRLERYTGDRRWSLQPMLKKAYYRLRPFMTAGMRARVQRFCARDWNDLQFPKWPVDTTVENICERLLLMSMEARGIDEMPFVWFWPKGAQGCVCMTHDVETKAGRDFCPTLMDIDDSFGIKSSFQLVPESRYAVTQELVESFRSRGFEVAIHGLSHDGTLFDDREEFLRDAAKINRYAREYGAKGFRADVLYRNPEWYDAFDFSFDMSIPNVGHLDPQRGGCCTVMPYFIGDILEIPVTAVQDYMLFHLLKQRSIDLWKAQVATILEKQGCVSFIVHPDYVMDPEHMAIYQDLLRHLQELRAQTNTWFALPHQIDNWWRSRSQMRVERVQGSWRIVGEGAEQAALAFARKVDGKLIYDVMEVAVAP